jgi:hypothetical protein
MYPIKTKINPKKGRQRIPSCYILILYLKQNEVNYRHIILFLTGTEDKQVFFLIVGIPYIKKNKYTFGYTLALSADF